MGYITMNRVGATLGSHLAAILLTAVHVGTWMARSSLHSTSKADGISEMDDTKDMETNHAVHRVSRCDRSLM